MPRPYCLWFLLESDAPGRNNFSVSTPRRRLVRGKMRSSTFDYLFLLPFALAETFLVWVLWNLSKQIRR